MRRLRPDAFPFRLLFALVAAALLPLSVRADGPFKHDYFAGNHRLDSALPNEHVDPLSGNLLVTATDLVLPGNAVVLTEISAAH